MAQRRQDFAGHQARRTAIGPMEEEGMGEEVEAVAYTREDRQRYREKVHQDLDVFEQMLTHHSFDYERPLTGMEIELSLVDNEQRRRPGTPRRPPLPDRARAVQHRAQRRTPAAARGCGP